MVTTIDPLRLPPEREWLSTGQAARPLAVSANRVYALVAAERLPYLQTQYGRLYDGEAVDALRRELDEYHRQLEENRLRRSREPRREPRRRAHNKEPEAAQP